MQQTRAMPIFFHVGVPGSGPLPKNNHTSAVSTQRRAPGPQSDSIIFMASSSDSSDDERRRKHKSSSKKEKKHKDRDRDKDKKKKSSHRHDDEKKSKRHKRDEEEKEVVVAPGITPISEADYFAKSHEFQSWLADKRQTYLDEISGEEARRLFRKFVSAWNSGTLSDKLYAGGGSAPAASRTRHQWAFKLSDHEQMQLDRTVDGVGHQTNLDKKVPGGPAPRGGPARGPAAGPSMGPSAGPMAGPSAGPSRAAPPMAPPPPQAAPQRAGKGPSWDPEAFKRSMGMS